MKQFSRVSSGAAITAEMFNALCDEVERLSRTFFAPPLMKRDDLGGISVLLDFETAVADTIENLDQTFTDVVWTFTTSTINLFAGNTLNIGGGVLVLSGYIRVTPTYKTWTGNQDNVVLADADVWIIVTANSPDPLTVTGFTGGINGRMLRVTNAGPAAIKFADDDVLSDAANRCFTPQSADYIIEPKESVDLHYEGNAANRWRLIEVIDPAGLNTDELAAVSSDDTTPGYLEDKITSGTGISVTVTNPGGNEGLLISATGGFRTLLTCAKLVAGVLTVEYTVFSLPDWTPVTAFCVEDPTCDCDDGGSGSGGSGGVDACADCPDTTPAQYRVTIASVVDGTCAECERMNGDFILNQSGADPCSWFLTLAEIDSPCSGSGTVLTLLRGVGSWLLTIGNTNPIELMIKYTGSAATNCDAVAVLNRGETSAHCSWPATVSIEAV